MVASTLVLCIALRMHHMAHTAEVHALPCCLYIVPHCLSMPLPRHPLPASQLCLGWALPIWAALLSEVGARSQFAARNLQHLQASEKEWAVTAAVGYDWAAMACE